MRFITNEFNYKDKVFSQEASTLFHGKIPDFSTTIYLQSAETGDVATYVFKTVDMVCQEDVAGWRWEPDQESIQRMPQLAGTEILIIND